MAEAPDKESKTEEATEKKLRDAIEKGNTPVSREASIFASVAGMIVIAALFLNEGFTRLAFSLERLIDDPGGWSLNDGADATVLFYGIAWEAGRSALPIIAILMAAGFAASLLQNAPSIAVERIRPDLSRLSLSKGWQRMFGSRGQTEFLKSVFKFGAISIVLAILLTSEQARVVNAMFIDPTDLPELILTIAMRLLAAVSVATIVLVAADLVWARFHWRRDLRMTRQEVKDEIKQVEGDPLVKSRLRSLARDRSRRRMIAAVPRATLVIVNPTHYAVALHYIREEGGAPLVLAKGRDLVALKIREVAEANQIPVVEDKPLARSLYEKVEVDTMIPPEFYRAVAAMIHFLGLHGPEARRVH